MPDTANSSGPGITPPARDVEACKDKDHEMPVEGPKPKNACLNFIAGNLHITSFLPIAIISVLQDIDLVLAAILCLSIVVITLLASYMLRRGGYIKVFPKKFDIFNAQLYVTILLLAIFVSRWMHNWISVYLNGSNAWFMWATILLPCCDCFVLDSARDRVPEQVARHPLMQEMAKWISVCWACALTVMAVAAIVPAALKVPHGVMNTVTILCSYVFGIGPFIPAIAGQIILKRVYSKKIRQAFAEQQQQQQQPPGKVQPAAADSAV